MTFVIAEGHDFNVGRSSAVVDVLEASRAATVRPSTGPDNPSTNVVNDSTYVNPHVLGFVAIPVDKAIPKLPNVYLILGQHWRGAGWSHALSDSGRHRPLSGFC